MAILNLKLISVILPIRPFLTSTNCNHSFINLSSCSAVGEKEEGGRERGRENVYINIGLYKRENRRLTSF